MQIVGAKSIAAGEIARVLAQRLCGIRIRGPAKRAPDEFVDVIVHTLRIGDEAIHIWSVVAKDRRFRQRAAD